MTKHRRDELELGIVLYKIVYDLAEATIRLLLAYRNAPNGTNTDEAAALLRGYNSLRSVLFDLEDTIAEFRPLRDGANVLREALSIQESRSQGRAP